MKRIIKITESQYDKIRPQNRSRKIIVTESQYKLISEELGDSGCDCCKYFNYNKFDDGRGLEVPLYFIFYKNKLYTLEHMSPKKYIQTIAQGFGGLTYDDALINTMDSKVKDYANLMKTEHKAPIGYYHKNKPTQEGRHRALAAMSLNCKLMPIVSIEDVDDKFKYELALKYMGLLDNPEELLAKLKQDFPTIKYTDFNSEDGRLDFNNFKNYVNHRMADYEESLPKPKQHDPEKLKTVFDQMDKLGLGENIELPIEVGDEVLMGKFRNKKVTVKDIDVDEYGHPTINGKKILNLRISKLMKKEKED